MVNLLTNPTVELPTVSANTKSSARAIQSFRGGRTAGIVGILTVTVAAFGYLREAALATKFGLSTSTDAYFGALFIPNLLYFTLIAGTVSPILIPILLQENATEDRERISHTFSVITNFVLLLLIFTVGCCAITARLWIPILFSGFSPVAIELTTRLTYLIFPGVLFLGLAGILTAVLNGFHKFALPAFAPALGSVFVIAGIVLAHGNKAIYIVGLVTAVGFALQCLVLLPATLALGIHYRPTFDLKHPAVRELLRLGIPLFLYLAVAYTSSLVERNLASHVSTGSVAALTYAVRLFVMPVNFIAASIATVVYPKFARDATREQDGTLEPRVSRMCRLIVFLFLPITIGMIFNALPLTQILYQHGHFRLEDSLVTSRVLVFYTFGLLPNALAVVLLRCFFALQDTITPLIAEIADLIYYIFAAEFLCHRFGLVGLAIARAGAFFLVGGILAWVAWKRLKVLKVDANLLAFLTRTGAASLAMGVVSWLTVSLLQPVLGSGTTITRLGLLSVVVLLSGSTFLGVALWLRVKEAKQILAIVWDLVSRPSFFILQSSR